MTFNRRHRRSTRSMTFQPPGFPKAIRALTRLRLALLSLAPALDTLTSTAGTLSTEIAVADEDPTIAQQMLAHIQKDRLTA